MIKLSKKQIAIWVVSILSVIVLILTASYYFSHKTNSIKSGAGSSKTKITDTAITYSGHDHITALDILKQTATVETNGEGENAFVTSINGIKADSSKNQYWSFKVNGKEASVGAGSYITSDDETITWELATY